jgi:hypothetical protein
MKDEWLAWLMMAEIYASWTFSWFVKIGRSTFWRRMSLRK